LGGTEGAGIFAVSFFASAINGFGATGETFDASCAETGEAGAEGGLGGDGGAGGVGGAGGAGVAPAEDGGRGGATGGTPGAEGGLGNVAAGGTVGGFGADGMLGAEGGFGTLGATGGLGAAGCGVTGLIGLFNIAVSRGFAAIGLLSLSFRGGRTIRTVSFLGSAIEKLNFQSLSYSVNGWISRLLFFLNVQSLKRLNRNFLGSSFMLFDTSSREEPFNVDKGDIRRFQKSNFYCHKRKKI
jgi:hypothetical protein